MTPAETGLATSGPAARLLSAFCALAAAWLAADKVKCRIYGGRFDRAELERESFNPPAVYAGCLAVASAKPGTDGAVDFDFRLAAAVAGHRTAKGEPRGAQAARLAARVAFELNCRQEAEEGGERKLLWPRACFSAAELNEAYAGGARGWDIGSPREVQAANLYSGEVDKAKIALWAVTWMQQFRARPEDFDFELPEPAGIPAEVLTGFVPDIGPGNEGEYGQVVPVPAGGPA